MRLIDADALSEEIESLKVSLSGRPATWDEAKADILQVIDEQPTVDAADVMRGMWISVKDRLPEPEEIVNKNSEDEFSLSSPVLTFGKNGFAIAMVERDEHHEIFVSFDGDAIDEVTHWRPLPEPPEVGKP